MDTSNATAIPEHMNIKTKVIKCRTSLFLILSIQMDETKPKIKPKNIAPPRSEIICAMMVNVSKDSDAPINTFEMPDKNENKITGKGKALV